MKNDAVCLPKPCLTGSRLLFAGLTLMILLAVGCSGKRHSKSHANPVEETFTLPPFLTGPVSPLLTNANDFSARMVVELPSFSAKAQTITGNLLSQGSHLLFAPSVGDRSFVWDMTQHSGFILSEALQGYAPIASFVQITNVVNKPGINGPVLESVNGRPCHRTEVVVSSSDGSAARFLIWREVGANGFPVKIKSVEGVTQMTINFFDTRREILAQKLFLPPDGFTTYASAAGMRDELLMRQKSVGKKVSDEGVSGLGHGEYPSQMGR